MADAETRARLAARAFEMFRTDLERPPTITLRGGNAVDSYDLAPDYDAAPDQPTDEYLDSYTFWGLAYLDAHAWRHYLPRLIDYALRNITRTTPGTMAIAILTC